MTAADHRCRNQSREAMMSENRRFTPRDDPDFNPYEAPTAKAKAGSIAAESAPGESLWRDGPLLVMAREAVLPDRCVRCNAPAGGYRLRRKLSWHPAGYYALILLHLLIYIVVALCIRKSATIDVGLCPDHRSRRARAIAIGWSLALVGVGLFVLGIALQSPGSPTGPIWLLPVGVVLLLAGLIVGAVGTQVVAPKRIDEQFLWLKKVDPEYLAEFPDWPR